MLRRWRLLLVTFLLALIVLNKVHAYYVDDNDEDDEDDENNNENGYYDVDYYDEYYNQHYEGDYCNEDQEGLQDLEDLEDLEEIVRLLALREITRNEIVPTEITTTEITTTEITSDEILPNESTSIGIISNGISPMAGQGLTLPTVSINTCSNIGLSNKAFRRFNAIFFGDFNSFGASSGALAVKGNFTVFSYIVNIDDIVDCSSHNSVDAYALVIGGFLQAERLDVIGDALINGKSDKTQIKEWENKCSIKDQEGTGLVDFDALEVEANRINDFYRNHPPTLQLLEDGSLKRLTDPDGDMEFITFNSCNDKSSCAKIWENQMSSAENILFGQGAWSGIQGNIKPYRSKTYVLNIPVIENTNITIRTNETSLGFNACKLVYNFYPVKQNTGEYSPTGVFNLARNTSGFLYGLILAPRGNIIDSPGSNFVGQIFALSYTYKYTDTAVQIFGYKDTGGACDYFDGCVPELVPTFSPEIVTMTSFVITTVTQLSTVTNAQVTQTVTNARATQTVTSLMDHFITITNHDPNTHDLYHINDDNYNDDEEYNNDSYKKKWHHRKYNEEEDDDCDHDDYY